MSRALHKRAPAAAAFFALVSALASCGTIPGPQTPRTSVYRNLHDIQFQYPAAWVLEDMSKGYDSIREAEREGSSYLQVSSYDPMTAANPAAPVPAAQVKITILLKQRPRDFDYQKLLAGIGGGLSERRLFPINGREAYELRYVVSDGETAERLEVRSIEYLQQDLYVKFICYPWDSVHVKEFESLAKSFRYRGR